MMGLLARVWRRLAIGGDTPLDVLLTPGFVAIDIETTTLDVRRAAIVSLAAIPFEQGQPHAGFVTLVNPGRPIPPESTAIHGIDDDVVAAAPVVRDVLPRLNALCARRIIVGHDVGFDLAVLARVRSSTNGLDVGVALDTRRLARATGYRDSRLEVVAADLDISVRGRHTAEGDARMAGEILLRLVPVLRDRGVRSLGELLVLQRGARLHDE